jgi:purine-binding chemotaxis protein CheW
MTSMNKADARTQFLSFTLAGEEYAVDILRVKEIIEYDGLTRVPGMPGWIAGVINLRGRVVPVADLRERFGLEVTAATRRTCVVIVEVASADRELVIGIVADSVSDVLDLAPDEVQAPPSFGTRISASYLAGMAEAGRKFVMILDVDSALASETLDAETLAEAVA